MFDPLYIRQAKLLLRCLPEIKRHACFALKGGTAINLFFRPMHELLAPQFKDIEQTYTDEFAGMPREEVPLDALCETREQLVRQIHQDLDDSEKRFLLSVKRGEPDWDALGIPHLRDLPALQWKLQNIRRMDDAKRRAALAELENVLSH